MVGKFLADQAIGKEVIRTTLTHIWSLIGRMGFKEIISNLFLIEFTYEGDKKRVWNGMPRLFEDNILVLKEYDTPPPNMMDFYEAGF